MISEGCDRRWQNYSKKCGDHP